MLRAELHGLAPISQEQPIGLVGDEGVYVSGLGVDLIEHGVRHLRHQPVATGENLRDLRFGEADGRLSLTGFPVLPVIRRHALEGHVTGEFRVGAADDTEDRRVFGLDQQPDPAAVTRHRRVRQLSDLGLREGWTGGVLDGRDQRRFRVRGLQDLLCQRHHVREGGAASVVHVDHPVRTHPQPPRDLCPATQHRVVRELDGVIARRRCR